MKQRAHIDSLSDDGRGITRIDGKVTFIEGALPGEDVSFRITRRKRAFDEGVAVSIEMPSPNRVSPRCVYFGTCGGCALQHLDSQTQLRLKEENVWRVLKHLGKVEPLLKLPALQAEVWHYRHRARLHVQSNQIGFKAKQATRVVEITSCSILSPKLEALLTPLNHLMKQLKSPSVIEEILMAEGKEGVSVLFRTRKPLLPQDKIRIEAFSDEGFSELTYPLKHHEINMRFSPDDFTQANVSTDELMLSAITTHWDLKPTDQVLDLFCGLGHFSLHLAPLVSEVLGVEGNEPMVQRARENALKNNTSEVKFMCADLENPESLKTVVKPFTKVILDPPRGGALKVVQWLPKIKPESILYISCHPATLARDAHMLVHEQGYTMTQACVVDMFPQTAHVEVMAWFEKRKRNG